MRHIRDTLIRGLLGLLLLVTTAPPLSAQDDGWVELRPGLERRVYFPGESHTGISLMVVRIDPARYRFAVQYQPGQRKSSGEWVFTTPGAVAFINANFFNDSSVVEGLLVTDRQRYGLPFDDYGGTFSVVNDRARVTNNATDPVDDLPLDQAIQGYPMLVIDGQPNPERTRWATTLARRSVIAEDSAGRILFIVTAFGAINLRDLSLYLTATDLEIVNALNLDGGVSTTLYTLPRPARDIGAYLVRAVEPVPAVLAVYARE